MLAACSSVAANSDRSCVRRCPSWLEKAGSPSWRKRRSGKFLAAELDAVLPTAEILTESLAAQAAGGIELEQQHQRVEERIAAHRRTKSGHALQAVTEQNSAQHSGLIEETVGK